MNAALTRAASGVVLLTLLAIHQEGVATSGRLCCIPLCAHVQRDALLFCAAARRHRFGGLGKYVSRDVHGRRDARCAHRCRGPGTSCASSTTLRRAARGVCANSAESAFPTVPCRRSASLRSTSACAGRSSAATPTACETRCSPSTITVAATTNIDLAATSCESFLLKQRRESPRGAQQRPSHVWTLYGRAG